MSDEPPVVSNGCAWGLDKDIGVELGLEMGVDDDLLPKRDANGFESRETLEEVDSVFALGLAPGLGGKGGFCC